MKYRLRKGKLIEKGRHGRWELTKKVLLLLGAGAVAVSLLIAPGAAHALKLFGLDKNADYRKRQKHKDRINYLFKRLKKNRLIEIYTKNGEDIVEITEAGRKRLLKYQLENLELKKPKRWDGKWRVIIFDIPEKHKKAREAIRHSLRKLGFCPLQKSVFVSPYPCRDEIDFISELFNVGKYVNYFEATSFDDVSKLKLFFRELD